MAAAFIETIPVRLDDNISVPIAAASTLWFASLTSLAAFSSSRAEFLMLVPRALAVNAVVSWLGYRARTVTVAGMIGGAFVGFVIYACAGGAAWLFLFAAFFAATAASRLGIRAKVAPGHCRGSWRASRRRQRVGELRCGDSRGGRRGVHAVPCARHARDRGRADGGRERHGRE